MPAPGILAQRIARMIESTGPISVAHYMAESNAHYYSSRDPLGSKGDFTTAPEISQMFGELAGLWLADLWIRAGKPDACHYVELGPGRGTLASDALRAMRQFGCVPSVHFVETSAALREIQRTGHPDALFHDDLDSLPEDAPLLIVANEFFDALPVHQIVATHAGWRERVVARDGVKFMPLPGSRPMDSLIPHPFRQSSPGTILETCPAASGIAAEMARRVAVQGGTALTIDYGYTEPRTGSSLQAVSAHAKADPFERPGEIDLTAHVNFEELVRIGKQQGVDVTGPLDQGMWLKNLGIEARAAALASSAPDSGKDVDAALHRLVDTAEMGELFKVLAYTNEAWPAPEGFAPSVNG